MRAAPALQGTSPSSEDRDEAWGMCGGGAWGAAEAVPRWTGAEGSGAMEQDEACGVEAGARDFLSRAFCGGMRRTIGLESA